MIANGYREVRSIADQRRPLPRPADAHVVIVSRRSTPGRGGPARCACRMSRGETMRSEPACSGHLISVVRRARCGRPPRPRSVQGQPNLHRTGAAGHRREHLTRRRQTAGAVGLPHTLDPRHRRRTSATTARPISSVSGFISTMMGTFGYRSSSRSVGTHAPPPKGVTCAAGSVKW